MDDDYNHCIECFGHLLHSESVGLLFSICIFFLAAVVATENERFSTNDIRFHFQNAIRTQKALLQMHQHSQFKHIHKDVVAAHSAMITASV